MKAGVKSILIILWITLTLSVSAQMTTFRFSYDLGAFDITGGMVQTPAREFVIAGLNNSFGPYYGDVMKIDTAGGVLWAKAYTAGFATNFSDIKNVSTGGYIVTGSSSSGGGGALLVRIDASGAVLWAFRYQLPNIGVGNASNEYGNAVIETSDGGFLVGGGVDYFWDGVSASTVDTSSAMGFKVNSSGTLQWSRVWTIATANPDEHYINDVAESADGYFFVGQSSEGSGTLSDGDYPSNALVIKTSTAGALTYIRRWGTGNTTSQGINAAITLSTGNILLGGFDDVHAFIVSISGVGAVTPTVIFNRRINGSVFGNIYLLQDVMENSDGNYSMIGTQLGFLSVSFNTLIGKINSGSGAWIFGRTYAPIGLSAILPEGGLCSDQGYYVSMTDQQMTGFNFNVIRTNTVGQTNDPAAGCPGTAITPALGTESITFTTPTSSNYNLITSSSFAPVVTNMAPTKLTHCFNAPSALSISSASSTSVTCNGSCNGTASVTATGGSGAYTYTWTPSGGNASSASGLCPNTYTCTISDGSTNATQTFTIAQPSAVSATQSQGTIACNGGTTTASVSASGGTGSYTYTWTPSGGNSASATLGAGNYTVTTADGNNCPTTNTFSITQPPVISLTVTASPAGCGMSNGTATVSASGGTGSYTYSWSPSGGSSNTASGLAANNYTVNVTDVNNCVQTGTVSVTTTNGPTATAVQTASVSCFGSSTGTASVSISGGTPSYTVNWSNGGSGTSVGGLAGGTYTATITDAGNCVTITTVTISQPASALSANTVQTSSVTCFGSSTGSASVSISGGTPSYTVNWSSGGTGTSTSGLAAGTYTATINDANNCITTTTVTITQPASALNVTAAQTASVTCFGGSNGTASVTISGGTPSYTVNWSSGGSGTSTGGLAAGTYTATINDANNCISTATVTITEPTLLDITVTATSSAVCGSTNGSATVTATGGTAPLTYSWSTGASGQVLSGVAGGSYTATVTDGNNCTNTVVATINSANGPSATAAETASVTCNGLSNGTASVSISGGTPNYTVTSSNGSVSGTIINNLPAGTFTATITDANNCVTTTTLTINEPTPIVITFTDNSPSACAASTGSVTANATGGTGVMTYTWNTGAGGQTLSNVPAGSYTVTATDANNCSQNATVSIVTVNGPTLTPVATATVACNGASTGSASVGINGGTPTYTVNWSGGGTGPSVTGLAAGIYTITVSDAGGCVSIDTVSISEAPAITSTLTGSPTGCAGSTGSATVSANGGTGVLTYTWSNSQTGTTASGLSAGVHTVSITDGNNCTVTNTISVGVTNPPLAAIDSVQDALCSGDSNGIAYASGSGGTPGYTFTWSNAQSGAVATGLSQGSYTVVITDAAGCKDSISTSIAQPTVLSSTITAMQPENCNLQNGFATVSASGGTITYSYQWSSGAATSTATGLGAGTYTIIVTDANGCKDTNTVNVTNVPGPTLTLSGQTNITCNGLANGSATVTATGGTPVFTYTWTGGATGTVASGLAAGSYTATVSDSAGCVSTTTVVIQEPGALLVGSAVTPVSCNGGSNGTATVTPSGGTSPYSILWSNAQTGLNASGLSAGTYTATVTDTNNCQLATTVIITENPAIDTLSFIGTMCVNDQSILLTAPNGNPITAPYQWYQNNNPIASATTYTYNGSTAAISDYSVTWFYQGCRYITFSNYITISQDLGILPQANVFSPNSDRINDEFLPFNLESLGNNGLQLLGANFEDYELTIYDRWGVLLFQSTSVNNTWDGKTSNGKEASDGTYYWIAKYKAKCSKITELQIIKGFVQLIR